MSLGFDDMRGITTPARPVQAHLLNIEDILSNGRNAALKQLYARNRRSNG
jgi:hypothetical protein